MDLTKAKSINRILVKVHSIYETSVVTSNGVELSIDATWMKIGNTVRYGEVMALPSTNNIGVEIGDIIYFHHHQVRPPIGQNGEMPAIGDFIKSEGLYLIDQEEIYGIHRGEEFISVGTYCFVKPYMVPKYDIENKSGLIIPNNEKEDEFSGVLWYLCDDLRDAGLKRGDRVVFSKNSKYLFPINGERMFRMRADWIQVVL